MKLQVDHSVEMHFELAVEGQGVGYVVQRLEPLVK